MNCLSELLALQNQLNADLQKLELEFYDQEVSTLDKLFILSEIIDIKRLLLNIHLEIFEFIPARRSDVLEAESMWA